MSKKLLFTLSGDTIDEIKAQLKEVALGLGLQIAGEVAIAPTLESAPYAQDEPAKRGRPKKTTTVTEVKVEEAVDDLNEAIENGATEKAVTKDMISHEMRELIGSGKADLARTLLAKFGANKISDIKEADYAKVFQSLKQAAAH